MRKLVFEKQQLKAKIINKKGAGLHLRHCKIKIPPELELEHKH